MFTHYLRTPLLLDVGTGQLQNACNHSHVAVGRTAHLIHCDFLWEVFQTLSQADLVHACHYEGQVSGFILQDFPGGSEAEARVGPDLLSPGLASVLGP